MQNHNKPQKKGKGNKNRNTMKKRNQKKKLDNTQSVTGKFPSMGRVNINRKTPQTSHIAPSEFEGFGSFEEVSSFKLMSQVSFHGKKYDKIEEFKDGKAVKKKNKKNKESPVDTNKSIDEAKPENNSKRKRETDKEEESISKKKSVEVNVEAWQDIFAPEPVVEAIKEIGFKEPSTIQKLTIPAAIKGHRDIVGAAETGSGKTLAFVIPIIHGILKDREYDAAKAKQKEEEELEEEEVEEEEVEEEEVDEEGDESECVTNEEFGCVKVIDNVEFDFPTSQDCNTHNSTPRNKLRALIITPTRELAVQIKKHTDAVLSKTDIKTAIVIGGLSYEKQERLLNRGPEIVIGTPGRLWELVQQGNVHLAQLSSIRYLAVDETDRMLEKGHFEELKQLLELVNSEPSFKGRRQNFVFSATLTMTHEAPKRSNNKKKVVEVTRETKLEGLMSIIGVRHKPKVVDITRTFGTAEMLSETKMFCDQDEKDNYLYYFLNTFPGRTLVFCNSINCVKRLNNLLNVLKCKPQALHASKQQKQRLKSLEKFTTNDMSVLLATDVAARGLDIPGVDHIIHYEVPMTAESYVHRSGRTARANHEGLSVLLIDSSEVGKYRQLCATLNRSSDLPSFPIDSEAFEQVEQRVTLAREIEKAEYGAKKKTVDQEWIQKMAQEAELPIDDSDPDDDEASETALTKRKNTMELKSLKMRLDALLCRPQIKSTFSGRYPTSTGKLIVPKSASVDTNAERAIDLVKKGKKTIQVFPKVNKQKKKRKKFFKAKNEDK